MSLKPGTRLWSTTTSTAVVVVRPPTAEIDLTCDGEPLAGTEQPAQGEAPGEGGTQLGKRYTDAGTGLEVLCTRAGAGALAVDGRPVEQVTARPLPASD
jgi:hypothetical protein